MYYVTMEDNVLDARSSVALLFVNMGEYALNAKSVEALLPNRMVVLNERLKKHQ